MGRTRTFFRVRFFKGREGLTCSNIWFQIGRCWSERCSGSSKLEKIGTTNLSNLLSMEPNFEHGKPTLPKKNPNSNRFGFCPICVCVHRPPLFFKDRISINRKSKCTFSQFETLHSRFSSKLKTVLRRDTFSTIGVSIYKKNNKVAYTYYSLHWNLIWSLGII